MKDSYCNQCGKQFDEDWSFCRYCGKYDKFEFNDFEYYRLKVSKFISSHPAFYPVLLTIVIHVLIVSVVAFYASSSSEDNPKASISKATAESSEVSKSEEIPIEELINKWRIEGLRKGTVARVIDGDTIVLSSGERIRYLEVSTPEIRNPKECYGDEATRKNSELVLGKTIYIQSPTEGKSIDKYGRTLAYVFTDEYFVFLELVKSGYAIVELYAPPNKFYTFLKQAEDDARLNNRGLWGKCN